MSKGIWAELTVNEHPVLINPIDVAAISGSDEPGGKVAITLRGCAADDGASFYVNESLQHVRSEVYRALFARRGEGLIG
jgi:hypothetical protein